MRRVAAGLAVLLALGAGAGALIGVELSQGALGAGESIVRDPCEPRPPFPGEGVDAAIQRIVLNGLDGAACELGTTREDLVLSFAPETGVEPIPWDEQTIERAVREGMLRALDDAERRGDVPGLLTGILRTIIEHAPIDLLIRGGGALADLLG